MGVASAVLSRQSREILEQAVTERQLLLTTNRAIALRDNLDLATTELLKLARSAEIDPDDGDAAPEQRLLGGAWRRSAFFNRSVLLYTPDGVCKWSEPRTLPCSDVDPRPASWFRSVLTKKEPAFIYVAEADGTGIATLAVPVVGADGKTIGVLTGTVDLDKDRMLGPALREEMHGATRVVLVSNAGVLLYVSPNTDLKQPEMVRAIAAVQRGETGVELVPSAQDRTLTAWAPVDYGGLGLVLLWPWSALDETSTTQAQQLLWLTLLVTLAALVIGWLASRLLARPLLSLVGQVREAEADPMRLPVATDRRDELGDLQRAFRRLMQTLSVRDRRIRSDRDQIAGLANTLERRVAERTRELEEAQTALLQSERLAGIGQAGALISHELRNSLNSINVGLDLIGSAAVKNKPELLEVRQQIRAEVTRLRELSDDLLTFAKEPRLALRRMNPLEVARTAIALTEEHADTANVRLELNADETLPEVEMDPDRIQSVLVNLLRNAVDSAKEGDRTPRVARLQVRGSAAEVVFRVDDSGPGLPPEVVQKLFQPFVTTKRTGVGLGLATADRFVRAHGASLGLCQGELGGACFQIAMKASES